MRKHTKTYIETKEDVLTFIRNYRKAEHNYMGFDTETDGLNIRFATPFLLIFGHFEKDKNTIHTYTLDLEHVDPQTKHDALTAFLYLSNRAKKLIAHNMTFDLHMMDNIPGNYGYHNFDNITDTTFYIRLTHPALKPDEGGPSLKLKSYAKRYLDPNAQLHEKRIKQLIKEKRQENTTELKKDLQNIPVKDEFRVSGKEKKWTKAMIDEFFKDSTNDLEDVPEDMRKIIENWQKRTPNPNNYRLLDRQKITEYAHKDVFYTLWLFDERKDYIERMGQEKVLHEEEQAIKGFYYLEKTGREIDTDYLYKSKKRMKDYIRHLRRQMIKLAGIDIKVNQNKLLKEHLKKEYGIDMSSTDKKHLKKLKAHEDVPDHIKELADIVIELRSKEKWYSTYLLRWIKESEESQSTRVYPTYNAAGAVTGRVTSDFQQFPKKAMTDLKSNELFHPRKIFVVPKGYKWFFLDYAAMELRILAIYTMLTSSGDLNLCRAYIPFECHQKDGEWYLNEDPETKWHPIDLHALTTKNAFHMTGNEPNFKEYRGKGKQVNFSMVYGATGKTISESLDVSKQEGYKIYNAFYKTYPGIRDYENYVRASLSQKDYVANLFGRKYYGITAHLGKNYLIQGSGADYTKTLLREIVDYLEDKGTKIEGYLHDEFSFIVPEGEEYVVYELQKIMEQLETDIKMKVDLEISETDWSEKHDYE